MRAGWSCPHTSGFLLPRVMFVSDILRLSVDCTDPGEDGISCMHGNRDDALFELAPATHA